MLSASVSWISVVMSRLAKLGKPVHSSEPTSDNCGKDRVCKIWTLLSVNASSIVWRLSPPRVVMLGAFWMEMPPFAIREMPSRAIASVVPVAMAMLPVNVDHVVRA